MFNKKNKVVQDPNSVGSALRTISLRLRGTSVKVLGELGEETDGVVESISKLQSKIKALTGVNILTESGSYKETYEILREIGQVWQDMNDVDQAALLELMAGKNRANTLAAILGNMEDLKGAYESALNSEGSALRENEAYLDSIQGKVDKFNNALQTMWMNWVSSDVVKGIVDIGTFFVDLAGKVDLVTIALSGLLTYLNLSSKSSLDFVSMLGIHDLKTNKWTFGKEGLTGWIAKLFTGAKSTKSVKNNIVENILGTPEDIENETKDFAESIQDNIGDFVTLDTTEIDAQIDYIQNKLITARESLEENSKIDWSKIEGEIPSKEERDAHLEYQRQQIKNLELELDNLQSKRNEIISSAATSTTSPAITQVQAETNAYQSMFSVLQEVKDIQLSIGDEQYASKTIDEIIKAAGNGQEALANYVTSLDATDTALGGTNLALKAYVASVDDGNYSLAGFQKFIQQHNAGLKQSGIAAKAAAVGHQLLNAAISIGISFLISAGISAITKYINKQKEMVESAQEAINTYEDAQKTLRSNKQTIDELAQSYAILSDGVDPLTNKNINLATDSYQEYLDVCNQIADIYPNLVTSFDSQGNAILSLKGNIDELIQAYKDAAQASRQEMIASGDDVFNAFKKTYDSDPSTTFGTTGYAQQLALAEKLQDLIAKGTQDEINAFFNNLNSGNIEINGQKYSNVEFDDLADSAGINDDFYKNGFIRKSNIDVESFQKQSTKLLSFIKSTTTKINTETNKVKTLMDAYLGENLNYAKFDDKTRTVVDQIISGLNADFINGFDNADDLWNWIETNVVNTFSDPKIGKSMSDSISNALNLQSQFENNDIILKDYQDGILSFVQTIKDSNLGEEVKRQILQMFDINFDRESSIGDEVDQMLNYVQSIVDKNAQSKVLELSYSDLKIINSDQFNIPSGTIFSWEALKQKIKEVKIAMTEDFTVSNFADYADSISALQENISAYQEALEKLESGSFTMSDFVKLIEKFPDLAKGVDTSSKSFKGLSTNLKKAIRSSPKSLIKDLKNLKQQLIDAGKSTDDIDNLINAMEELPVDTVQSLSDEYITLADAINGAKIAQNELKDAMSENPNEGFETRAEAMEYMKEALSRGEIGSESNVWNVAEQYGFTYDSAKSINENADALANFITVRNKWYAKDDDGNYSYEGTENFINAVEQAVAKSSELQKYMSWTYEDGVLSFDFDNANWDKIISYLRQTEELAGITSEEFYDLLMQIGQFHNINWQDSDDLLWYLNQLKDGTKSISENFDSAKNAIQSFLENNDISLSWLDEDIKIVDTDSFKKLPEEIQKVLTEYYDLKAKFEADPLGIKFQLDKNSSDKVTKESLETLSQLTTVLQDNGTGTVFIDYTHLKEAAKEAGYTEEAIDGIIDKIKEYNNVCGIERTADDPLGLIGLQENAKMTEQYLAALQIKFESIQNANNTVSFKVETESLIDALISQGWTAEDIQSYLTTLENSGTYSFTIDGAEVKLSTEDAQSKINQLIEDKQAMSNGETTQYTVTGPGEASVDHIKSMWDRIPMTESTRYSIYETTYKNSVDNGVGVNGTAHVSGNWGTPRTETALVGELGPELIVDPKSSSWYTVGDTGAEFTTIPKGSIVFNHKQTEQLLKNGYVTGRGKAYARGTSYGSNSLLDRMRRITKSNELEQLAKYAEEMCEQYEKLVNGNVDLRKRPHLSPSYEHELAMNGGYYSFIGSDGKIYASTSAETMTIGEGKNQYTIDITPVLENGEALTSDSLAEYVNNLVTDGSMQNLLDSDKYNLIIRAVPGEYNEKDWSGFENKLSEYKDGYLNTILNMFDLGGEKAVEAYGFSSVGLADVSRDLRNNGSYTGKEVTSAIDDTSEGMRNLNELINQYVTDVLNAKSLADEIGTDLSKTQYGNVDTDSRQKLYWDEGSIDKYSDALDSWRINAEEIIGTYSTLLSAYSNFDGVDIAFSPILQTEDGPQLLDSNTVHEYIWGLIDKASKDGKQWISEELFQLDTEGLEFNGTIIKNLLEDIGESASTTSQLLHYVGDTGAISSLEGEIESTASGLVATGENISNIQAKLDLLNATNISDKTFTVTEVYQTVGSGRSEGVHIPGSGGRYTKYANGTVHVNGNAYSDGSFGAPKTETALVGELGPELLVRNGRWTTIGEDGAEFAQVKKGDIIFNHEQTEDLLSKGYVTGRGKAYASGTAYVSGGSTHKKYSFDDTSGSERKGSGSSSSADDAKDQFEELFDWIEVRLEEINKQLDFKNARLENSVGYSKQNKVIDEMLDLNEKLYDNLIAGANKYYEYAGTLLAKIPAEYRQAAQDGSIAIETFIGEVDEETYNAIQEFREWVQKGDDAVQQAEEAITEASSLAKQAIDNIATDFGNKNSLRDSKIDQLDAYNALTEAKYGAESEAIYKAIIKETNKNIKTLQTQRDKMQAELDKQVREGNIQKYSQDWYDAVNDIAAVDTEIINLTADTYDYQDSMNELHWDYFDNLLGRFEAISDEADNLIDILGSKDLVDESGNWTKEGITSLGIYAQKMEVAEMQAKKYQDEINYLNKNWKKLGYTEQEYVEKLDELKEGQYDAIKAYNDTKKAIVDLNKERVEAIKNGIQQEIDAYEELINKKKEALDADKDAHDWQKTVADKQKNIADIERKIAALSTDNSASARAQRAKLESELLEAKADLEETYYDRSIAQQQTALDKELENFKENKDKEIEGWNQYLENTEQVVADSLSTVQTNTDVVYNTLKAMGKEYSLAIAESLTSPWKDGETAIQSFSEKFGLSMSSTVEELQRLAAEYKKVMDQIEGYGNKVVDQVNDNASQYQQANNPSKPKFENPETVVKPVTPSGGGSSSPQSSHAGVVSGLSGYLQQGSTGSNVKTLQQALNDLGFNAGTVDGIFGYNTKQAVMRFQSSSKYGGAISADGIVGPNTKKKFKAAGYAKGTIGVKKNQLALIDELGEELQLVPDGNGRLAYLKKGTAVIPHDISENLMQLGQLNPQDILDRNRPTINAPHITNNETVISIEYGDILHIENFNGDKPEDLSKMIDKAFNKHMKELNQQIRRYTR